MAGFAQSLHSTVASWQLFLAPHSPTPYLPPVLAYDRIFAAFAHSAFNGRILAGFAQSLHSTVAFWQLFLSPHSHTPPLAPLLAYDRIFVAFAYSQHSTVTFWQVLRNLCIRRSRFGSFSSLRIRPPHTCPLFLHTIEFLQLLLSRSIQRSHFGRFCPISAFDGRVLAGFAQSLHSTVAFWHLFLSPHSPTLHLPPRSRIRSEFCSFRSLSAFNGRILAGFAQSLHSMVTFWQLFLSAFSQAAPGPSSRIPSCFGSFHSFSIRWWHLAAFADFQYSIVAFWQLALPPCNLTHLCSLHSNTVVYW